MRLQKLFPLLLVFVTIATIGAQDTNEGGPDFGLGITIGAQSFPNPEYDGSNEETITFQSLGLTPDLAIGKFGLGLDLTLNYRFTGGDGSEFEVRSEDWVPDDETNFLELYLPKIRYARWGLKGDPLYVLLGSV